MQRALLAASLVLGGRLDAQTPTRPPPTPASQASLSRGFDDLTRAVDDVYWQLAVGDIARVSKVTIASTKPARGATGPSADDPLVIYGYTFIPKEVSGTAPLVVLVHGGMHSNLSAL